MSIVLDIRKGYLKMSETSSNTIRVLNDLKEWKDETFNVQSPDNWVFSNDSKTLTGENFLSLYDGMSYSTEIHDTDNGNAVHVLNVSSEPYNTEMVYADLKTGQSTMIEAMPVKKRVAYEVTLLSKQYANKSINASSDEYQNIEKEYSDKMSSYSNYCDENNISWSEVMHTVSTELQRESLEYTTNSKDLWKPGVASANATNANIAHRLQLSQAGPDFVDVPIPQLENSGVSYDDTLSSEVVDRNIATNIFGRIKESFNNVVNWFKDFHPIKTLQSNTHDYIAKVCEVGEKENDDYNAEHGTNYTYDNASKYFDMAKDMLGDVVDGKDVASQDYSQYD